MRRKQTARGLREFQRRVAGLVMRPLAEGHRLDPAPIDGAPPEVVAAEWIRPGPRLRPIERLEIYNRQYWFRLLECLEEDFPGLKAVLGSRGFSRLACEYLEAHPSTSFTLRNLGQHLVAFLGRHAGRRDAKWELSLDMARLEWAHVEAFDNAAGAPLEAAHLRSADPRSLRLELQPHLRLVSLDHALDRVLIRLRRNTGLRSEASQAKGVLSSRKGRRLTVPKSRRPIHVAVHRQAGSVYYKRLSKAQFTLLTSLGMGRSLSTACSEAFGSRTGPRHATLLATWFRDWAALGWFVAPSRCRESARARPSPGRHPKRGRSG
ncbi:MAG: putative DNA-binding domain-containing protein [Verrucomicrobiales bacterium]|nr:putative DNA-binding domain-containing protein [Verrucomicrobiales bacterium]